MRKGEPGRPFFMFNVTMQNHGGYSEDEPAVDVTVTPVDKELQTPQMLEYLSLIRESDAAFKELTDYFSEAEEDTVILMFGDHQPSMDEGVSEFMDRKLEERDGELDSQRRYYASFILWANFDIQEMSDVVTSPGFLRPLLLEAAGQFRRKLQIDELRLRLVAGAPDPADAALRYGQANALLGAIWQPVTRVFHVKDGWARMEVDFERTEPALYGRVSLSLTVGELAALGLSFGVKALSVLLAVRREDRQRTGQKQNAAV